MAIRKAKAARVQRRQRVKRSVRKRVSGTVARPRLTVFRSNRHIYAQLIDDVHGHTLASASSLEKVQEIGAPATVSEQVGRRLASRARDAGIETVVLDRNGYRYQGRVKTVAEAARKGGLTF